jgi:hypothetical protein
MWSRTQPASEEMLVYSQHLWTHRTGTLCRQQLQMLRSQRSTVALEIRSRFASRLRLMPSKCLPQLWASESFRRSVCQKVRPQLRQTLFPGLQFEPYLPHAPTLVPWPTYPPRHFFNACNLVFRQAHYRL